ncbi:hypothetical protein PICMEDRAFT_64868 [Pichia membranifaciens NRRL Y-2026]|uniref:RRM domain-containing protein n=1 Tax=Pichia membranifaciens NRRL Y-2026 TaxID=763406 RepID=A0A1E3NGH1_9ASCO|nr:hypothetical protein PICMEDRAFT_64868 [Pichia membranifaciens NRRL Y-2026]ODQ45237.1 hypothetical protein PICMEDRAFT_64868 [Pichia membranifaciens NRRL Y-2026]
MTSNDLNQATKVSDLSLDETHSFPKSLRYIKSKWLGKEDKRIDASSKENIQSETEGQSPVSRPATNHKTAANINFSTNPTTINLDVDSDLENLSKSVTPSPEKGKRRKAFHTIKSYLEKNKSQQSIETKQSKEPQKEDFSSVLVPDSTPSSNQLTIFEEKHHKTAENCSSKQDYSIDTIDTKLDQPKTLFEIFKVIENKKQFRKELADDRVNQSESDSELSSDVLTISKNKNEQNENISRDEFGHPSKVSNAKVNGSVLPIPMFNYQTKMISLYVGDLDKSVTETDLYMFFSKYEGLISVKIPLDTIKNESLSYGYVNFDNQAHADLATDGLNYTSLKGSDVRIMPSLRDKTQRENMGANLFFSKLSHDLSSRIMFDRLKVFGKILSCKYSKEKGTCFVNFADKLQAYKICKQFNETKMDDRIINVSVHISKKERESFQQHSKPVSYTSKELIPNSTSTNLDTSPSSDVDKKSENVRSGSTDLENENQGVEKDAATSKPISTQYSIFIRNMPLHLKRDVVRSLVEPYGTVKNILTRDVPIKQGSWALVTMTNKAAVDKTIQSLNSVELEGKQLFVTRAIPREEKEYAKREEKYPKKKLKLLVSQIDMEKDKESLENWCSKCGSIKSAEFYASSNDANQSNGYGYIELNDENDADNLVKEIRELGVSCYKIKIEIPSKENNFETFRYPYVMNALSRNDNYNEFRKNPGVVSFSYVDPNKMFQLANFQKTVDNDKISVFQRLENNNKTKFKERGNPLSETDEEILKEKQNEMYRVIWEICVRLFIPKPEIWANQKYCAGISPTNEILSKSKISSLTNHLVKFFWANNFNEFYKFMKQNQFDKKNRLLYVAHPVLANQIVQSATYLGIVPK